VSLRPFLQPFAHLTGDAFRLLPRSRRFAAARRIALALAPLLRRLPYYRRRPSLLDGPREEALRIVLRSMTRAGVTFDVDAGIHGRELVPDGGMFIVSGHFLLNVMMTRWIHEAGRHFIAGLGGPREPMFYAGTRVPLDHVFSSPQIFTRVRKKIAARAIVFLTIEVPVPQEGWIAVETAAGTRYVSPATFTFAARTRTPVLYAATYLDERGRLCVFYERPTSEDPETMAREFCAFLQRHAATVRR
jgi:hypothetical protein